MNVPRKRALTRKYSVSEGTNAKLEKFVHIDNEDNEKYATTVLEDVEELLEMMKIVEMAMDDDGDVNTQELNVGLENEVIFQGFDSFISRFSKSRISCSALKFKQKQRKHSMTLRNCLNHFNARCERSASKPNAKNFKTYAK